MGTKVKPEPKKVLLLQVFVEKHEETEKPIITWEYGKKINRRFSSSLMVKK